jgi:type II secretion system protein H
VRDKGFSLIEVIIVLLILSLSIALVTPSLSRFSSTAELKTAAKKVSAILRFCRSEAVNKGQIYQIVFDSDLGEVRVQRMEPSEGEEENKKQEGMGSKKTYPLPKGIHMKEVKIASPQYPSDLPTFEFYPNGGSNGGSILFDGEDRGGYRIKVNFLTGMVEIEKV